MLLGATLVSDARAQRPNVPGIISGAVEGDMQGAAGSAMGYDYWSGSGYYYPGSRQTPYSPYYGYGPRYDRRIYSYPAYGNRDGFYRDRYYRDGSRTTFRPVPRNPSVDDQPYRAVIVNNEENGATLRFAINGEPYELEPGKQIEFSGRTPRVIRFDRGNGKEVARYTLAEGQYTFAPTKNGWELYRNPLEQAQPAAAEPAADNPRPEGAQTTVTGETR